MKQIRFTLLILGLLVIISNASAFGQGLEPISVNSTGTGTGNSDSAYPLTSANGRYVAFVSYAGDLAPNDTNNAADVFVRDTVTGATKLVTMNSTGTASANAETLSFTISANGRFVLFSSTATDLVPNDTNGSLEDVFIRDLVTDTTSLVSINRSGSGSGDDGSYLAGVSSISANGRFVTFLSSAHDLVSNNRNLGLELYIRDLVAGTTSLVTVNRGGTGGSNYLNASTSSISADGRFVAFDNFSPDLVTTPTNGGGDVFVRDVVAGTTRLVSINMAGTSGGDSGSGLSGGMSSISADGRFVVFYSLASDLTDNGCYGFNVYVRDLQSNTTTLVSISSDGTFCGGGSSFPHGISPNGRFVMFDSEAGNLVSTNDNNSTWDVFVRDLEMGTTTLVSVNRFGNSTGNGSSITPLSGPGMSSDGRFVVFTSEASDILATDPNVRRDVFLRDLVANTTTLVSLNKLGTRSGNGESDHPTISSDGQFVAFDSTATDLLEINDVNRNQYDVFRWSVPHPIRLQFKTDRYRADEGAGEVTITVERVGVTEGEVEVRYATYDGTARAGKDYTAARGTLTFADGETIKSFTIPIIEDALDEANETVNLTLSNPQGGAGLGDPQTAVLLIGDNDSSPSLSINDVSVTEGNAGMINATFVVTLSAASGKTVAVNFATANGTAVAGRDYVAATGRLTFNPGEKTKRITVAVNGDMLHETDEAFRVNLSAPVNATIADGSGIGMIVNDD